MKLRTLGVVLTWAMTAWAEDDPVTATELFKQGREAMASGDAAGACARFSESLRLDVKVGTLLNLAECEDKLGQLANARQHLIRAIGIARAENDDRMGLASERFAILDARVPRLTITLGPGAVGAIVKRDGIVLGAVSLGAELPINPGRHVITVSADGRAESTTEIKVEERDKLVIEAPLGAPEETRPTITLPAPIVTPVAQAPSPWIRTSGFVIGASGIAATVGGIIAGVAAVQTNSMSKMTCDATNVCDPHGKELRDQARTMGDISTALFITGGVLLAAGLVVVLVAPKSGAAKVATAPFVARW